MNRPLSPGNGAPRFRATCSFWPRAESNCGARAREKKSAQRPMAETKASTSESDTEAAPTSHRERAEESLTVIGNPPVSAMTTPRQMSIVPSVTTKEWMRNLTTSAPLIAPRRAPTKTAAGAATIGQTPASRISTVAT